MTRWAIAAAAAHTWRQAKAGWRDTPKHARRRWVQVIVTGWIGCALLGLGLAYGARELGVRGMDARDREQLLLLVDESPISFQTAIWFEGWGSSAMLIPVVLVAVIVAARARRAMTALTIAASYFLHDPLVFLMNWVWPRVRPDVVAEGIASPPLHSFPSGHTVQVIAVYGLLAFLWARRSTSRIEQLVVLALLGVLTTIVAYSRLRLGTHWPSDIWGALPLGTAWLLTCVLALRAAERATAGAGLSRESNGPG